MPSALAEPLPSQLALNAQHIHTAATIVLLQLLTPPFCSFPAGFRCAAAMPLMVSRPKFPLPWEASPKIPGLLPVQKIQIEHLHSIAASPILKSAVIALAMDSIGALAHHRSILNPVDFGPWGFVLGKNYCFQNWRSLVAKNWDRSFILEKVKRVARSMLAFSNFPGADKWPER